MALHGQLAIANLIPIGFIFFFLIYCWLTCNLLIYIDMLNSDQFDNESSFNLSKFIDGPPKRVHLFAVFNFS